MTGIVTPKIEGVCINSLINQSKTNEEDENSLLSFEFFCGKKQARKPNKIKIRSHPWKFEVTTSSVLLGKSSRPKTAVSESSSTRSVI